MAELDLIVAGGTIVASSGRRRGDIGIKDGRIVSIGDQVSAAADVIDATGLLVLPGGVDTHVHLMDPGSTDREDFPSGTRAAAAAGVTTIIEHSHGHPVRTAEDLRMKAEYLRGRSNVDFALAVHAWPGYQVAPVWAAGAAFFKVFTCTTHGVPGHDAGGLQRHLLATAAVGAVSLIHCEDESLTESAEAALREEERRDGGLIPQWRSREAEEIAAMTTAMLVRQTGARASIAHVSNPGVADYLAGERARGAQLMAETCPQYLLLREQEVLDHGAFRKFTPPVRARHAADEADMWRALRDRRLTHVSSDHAPSTAAQKTSGDIWDVHFGLPGIDTTLSLLLDAAARELLAYEDIARLYSETPARLYGLWPRKGAVAPGFDADLALVDPSAHRTLRSTEVFSKAGWTPYDGRPVTGRVVRTLLRGTPIAVDGRPVDDRAGRFLPGAGHPAAAVT